MPSNRCQCVVFDTLTKRNRLCKNKKKILDFCSTHVIFYLNKYVIKIQSVYKGYYIRKKIDIFYKLPRDLQRKVIWHMNKEIYLNYFHSSISKIIYSKYEKFTTEFLDILLKGKQLFSTNQFKIGHENIFNQELYNIVKLSIKYSCLINKSKILNNIRLLTSYFHYFELIYISSQSEEYKLIMNYYEHFVDYKLS